MTKNYFTDEQVSRMAESVGADLSMLTYDEMNTVVAFTESQLKSLMNLAVETAIGEEVAYQYDTPTGVDGLSRIELSRNKLNAPKDTTITQLYSVKELEN